MPASRRHAAVAAAIVYSLATGPLPAQNRGLAEVAFQGYYLGGDSRRVSDTSGLAINFHHFVSNVGLLRGNLEGYGQEGDFRYGENYLELRGFPLGGRRWTFTGGDFRVSPNRVGFPFHNFFIPQITARGARVEASRKDSEYSVFWGTLTLQQGPRVPFRIRAPQAVVGASVWRKTGGRLEAGAQILRLMSSEKDIEENPFFFPVNRDFGSVNNLSLQTLYSVNRDLKLYGEVVGSEAKNARGSGSSHAGTLSFLGGAVWDSPKVTMRANYAHQSASYLPLAGYFVGDRRGPFGEIHLRPSRRLQLFGSASQYTNNLKRDPRTSTFESRAGQAGASITLPWKLTANAQLSRIQFSARSSEPSARYGYDNRHWAVNFARPVERHNVRLTLRDMKLSSRQGLQRHKSAEVEDLFHSTRFVLGAAARFQTVADDQRRNTLFLRGSVQLRLGHLTGHAHVEIGNDLVNRTVFATHSFSTTVISLSAPLGRSWSLQFEAFRNRLHAELNPERIFVLANRGLAPYGSLSSFNQWSYYFRLVRRIQWGGVLSGNDLGNYAVGEIPVVGAVQGFVNERALDGIRPAEGVPVSIDYSRTAISDAQGRFRFAEVPEGVHLVTLVGRELPAQYDPGPVQEATVTVIAKRTARVELEVIPLTSVQGIVVAPGGVSRESILIRLMPTQRYTTTDSEGQFSFQNLPEGDYELAIELETLPENSIVTTPLRVPVSPRVGMVSPPVKFEIKIENREKPVRMLELAPSQALMEVRKPEGENRPEAPRIIEASVAPASADTQRSYAVEAGAFPDPGSAERMQRLMEERHGLARIVLLDGKPAFWPVLVGDEQSEADAALLARKIKDEFPQQVASPSVVLVNDSASRKAGR